MSFLLKEGNLNSTSLTTLSVKNWLIRIKSRLRAAWEVLSAGRYVVVTYDPKQPTNVLGTIYLGAPCQEVPGRLAAATMAAVLRNESLQGQEATLALARQLYAECAQRGGSAS